LQTGRTPTVDYAGAILIGIEGIHDTTPVEVDVAVVTAVS